jgi:hypothetical protein
MVGQSIESRTRTALVIPTGSFESVFPSDINGLLYVDDESLGLLELLH